PLRPPPPAPPYPCTTLFRSQCLSRLGEQHSTLKDTGAKVMAFAQSLSGVVVSDEVVKGAMALYVFTQMEICSYKILAEAAAVRIDRESTRLNSSHVKSSYAV